MKRHLLLIYWLVLLVSTLAISAVAFKLLDIERASAQRMATDSAVAKGKTIAENLDLLVDDAKDGLMDSLASFPDTNPNLLESSLTIWKDANPYVRSVFLYNPIRGELTVPRLHTAEWNRLEPLLQAGHSWIWDADSLLAQQRSTSAPAQVDAIGSRFTPTSAGSKQPAAASSSLANSNYDEMKQDRIEVRKVTKTGNIIVNSNTFLTSNDIAVVTTDGNGSVSVQSSNVQTIQANGQQVTTIKFSQGMPDPESSIVPVDSSPVVVPPQIPGNGQAVQLVTVSQSVATAPPEQGWASVGPPADPHWIAWFRPARESLVRGVELDLAKLLSKTTAFPSQLAEGEGFILRNPAGKAVISRLANSSFGSEPFAVLNIGPEMPGWTLGVYLSTGIFSSRFVLVSSVMVGILMISMLAGGTLLLRQARREASDAARKTSFVSNVSHELKTPLTTIRMYAELLGDNRVRDEARQRNYLDTIITESQRLTRLVNNVLDFSRLEQGHKQYNSEEGDLVPLISRVLETQRPRLEEAGFKLEANLPAGDPIRIYADRDAIEQVLLNLLDNAMKYASSGGWLGLSLQRNGADAILTVSDHGPGVPAAHRRRIFDTFHRVDDSLTASQPGSGLGLSIARRLLRDQGGDLRCEPNQPTGAKFIATIPLAE